MKHFLSALLACSALALLAGCPQSKIPDTPPTVPQPKATASMVTPAAQAHTFEI